MIYFPHDSQNLMFIWSDNMLLDNMMLKYILNLLNNI